MAQVTIEHIEHLVTQQILEGVYAFLDEVGCLDLSHDGDHELALGHMRDFHERAKSAFEVLHAISEHASVYLYQSRYFSDDEKLQNRLLTPRAESADHARAFLWEYALTRQMNASHREAAELNDKLDKVEQLANKG